MQACKRLTLALFFAPACCYAGAISNTARLEELIMALVGGALLSIVAMVVVFIKLKKPFWHRALIALSLPLVVFPVCVLGSMLTSAGLSNFRQWQNQRESLRAEAQNERDWQKNFLRSAACEGEHERFAKELTYSRHEQASKQRTLEECIIPRASVTDLRALLADFQKRDERLTTYCAYLNPVLVSLDTSLMEVFVEQHLPLTCKSQHYPPEQLNYDAEHEPPSWWDVFASREKIPAEQLLPALRYLQAHEVDLKRIVAGRSLLSLALESSNVAAIEFALDLGMDPHDGLYKWDGLSPAETWVVQSFSQASSESYSIAARQRLQPRLGVMTAAQAEMLAHKLHKKVNLEMLAHGGADMLAYLLRSGASMRRLNEGGNLVLGNTPMSAELLTALKQLNDAQLADFICPEADEYNRVYSLFAEAIASKNKPLIALLRQRKMPETCPVAQK
ncbi:hypothetical protein [Undibacterium pigrum]|uniref:Ankyrin repeat protein n=1 Tax=Undibacterium pigrum TaxID=401470 RepID=A0A318J3W7_9BURK|nr:hypothetical protein [Undibacterium pigrum]PXX41390.1 hypothetical protein DFR42_10741 [Undibacterium pigrum]